MKNSPEESKEFLSELINLKEKEAIFLCNKQGYQPVVVKRDSETFLITTDLNFNRVRLKVEKGVIVQASVG